MILTMQSIKDLSVNLVGGAEPTEQDAPAQLAFLGDADAIGVCDLDGNCH